MSPGPVTGELRAVLAAPRGSRFSRPGVSARLMATPLTREQRMLAQMVGNPRVAHRQKYGQLPHWMYLQAARMAERERQARDNPEVLEDTEGPWKPLTDPDPPLFPVPKPRPAPDDGPPAPRPSRPPLPRRPRRPHSHRKPRHRRRPRAWGHLFGYTLATASGALAHHLAPLLS